RTMCSPAKQIRPTTTDPAIKGRPISVNGARKNTNPAAPPTTWLTTLTICLSTFIVPPQTGPLPCGARGGQQGQQGSAHLPGVFALSVGKSSGFGAPVPVEPRKSLRPSGNVTLRAFARFSE